MLYGFRFRVYAEVAQGSDESEFERQLRDQARQADARGILGRLRRYAELGSSGHNSETLHSVDPDKEIWEFIKGDLRAFCFFDDSAIVVMSTVSVKKSRKVDPLEVAAAKRLAKRYFEAKAANMLTYGG